MLTAIIFCYENSFAQTFPNINFSQIPISGQVIKANGKVYISSGDISVWDGFRTSGLPVPLTDNKPLQAKKVLIKGNIFWIESNDGVSVYNSGTGSRIIYSQTEPNELFRIKNERGAFFLEDAMGQMYLIAGLLYKVNKDYSLQEIKQFTNELRKNKIEKIDGGYKDREGTLWICFTHSQLTSLNNDGSFKRLYDIKGEDDNTYKLYQDTKKRYWLYCWYKGLLLFDPKSGEVLSKNEDFPSDPVIHDMCEWRDKEGRNWFVITEASGIYIMNTDDFSKKAYLRDFTEKLRTVKNSSEPYELYVDDEDILWINTGIGNELIIPARQQFANYSLNTNYSFKQAPFPARENGDVSVIPNRISSLGNQVWIGGLYGKGVAVFSKPINFITNYPNYTKTHTASDTAFIDFNFVTELPDSNVLFSSYKSIGIWDKKNKVRLMLDEQSFSNGHYYYPNFTSILPLSKTDFLIKSSDCIFSYHYPDNKIKKWFSLKDNALEGTPPKSLRCFGFTKSGFYILYESVLIKYNFAAKKIEKIFSYDNNNKGNYFPSLKALKFVEDSDGALWIVCEEDLFRFDPKTEIFVSYKGRYNLPDQFENILKDSEGRLWLASGSDLYGFLPAKNKTFSFKGDGALPGNTTFALWQDSTSHKIWMSSENYLTNFNPDSILNTKEEPQVYLNKVLQGDSAVNFNTNSGQWFHLPYDKSSINFLVSFHHLNRVNKPLLAFRLNAGDKWKYSENGTCIFYNLGPGHYVLQLAEAVSVGNVIEKNMLLVPFVITPPFYKSAWFIALCFLSLITIGLIYFKLHNDKQKAIVASKQKAAELLQVKTELEKQLAETQMAALRSQMNPHFLFNVLNSIQKYILQEDKDKATEYLTSFSRLIRMVLENSKSSKVTLATDLEALKLYIEMERMRFGERFNFEINVAPEIDQSFVHIPPLIIQPYVENAIWHGLMQKKEGTKILKVDITMPEEHLVNIVISDNGIGRKKATELKSKSSVSNKSFGMQITKDRIGIVNKILKIKTEVRVEDLINEANEPAGTKVTLIMNI